MNKFILLFLLCAFAVTSHAQTKYWDAEDKLTWEDYKGEAPATRTAARSYVGFSFYVLSVDSFTNIGTYSVRSFFISDSSWVQPGLWHRDDLLEHEQLHFDLAELYASQIRKLIEGRTPKEAREIYNAMLPEYRRRQRDYDIETRHGINSDHQIHWNQMIEDELLLNR